MLGSVVASSHAQTTGDWITEDGTVVRLSCPSTYMDLTRLPSGCVNTLNGGGILWTSESTSKNDADLQRAGSLIRGLKLNIDELRKSIKASVDTHALQIDSISREAIRDLGLLKSAHRSDVVTSFTVGVTFGILASVALAIAL